MSENVFILANIADPDEMLSNMLHFIWAFTVCESTSLLFHTVKPVLSGHSKRTPKIGFQYRISLNAGHQGEHSAILSTSIKLPFSIKTLDMSILSGRLTQVLLVCLKSHFKCA